MILITYFYMTIITFTLLSFVLINNVIFCVFATYAFSARTALRVVRTVDFWMQSIILSSVLLALFSVFMIISFDSLTMILNIIFIVLTPIAWLLCQVSLPSFCFARLALRVQSASLSVSQIKVFSSSGLDCIACSAFPKSFWRCVQSFFSIAPSLTFRALALFAQRCQTIRFAFIRVKLCSCWLIFITSRTKLQRVGLFLWGILRYTDIHDGRSFLLSRLGCYQYRWFEHRYSIARQNHIQLPHHYTINPLHKQVYGHIFSIFLHSFNVSFSIIGGHL